jgi:hypothetical protein
LLDYFATELTQSCEVTAHASSSAGLSDDLAPRGPCVVFRAQSIRSNTRQTVVRDYKEDVDLIVVHCPDTHATYAVPIEDATKTQGTLRISPTANGQAKGVRWARDYELPA